MVGQPTNLGDGPRRFSLTAFVEWTLGAQREHTQHQVHTSFDADRRAILARNTFDAQFAGTVAFCALSEPIVDYTADRREFLGRNGTPAAPASLAVPLTGTTGAALDPCAALRCLISLAPGESREVVFALGAAEGEDAARALLDRLTDPARARAACEQTVARWHERLSTITVRTPEPSFDAMINRWLAVPGAGCRMWARSALYQSSGAYGFRDQLQDVMALVYAEPGARARAHPPRGGRQFVEGDVQHWWHPPSGPRRAHALLRRPRSGCRTSSTTTSRVTGDARGARRDGAVPRRMRPLEPDEHEVYDLPSVSDEHGVALRALPARAATRPAPPARTGCR